MTATQTIIEQNLPEDLWKTISSFIISDATLTVHGKLIELILRSRSIDTIEEKQNWFNLLPMMNQEQIEKLYWILEREKEKLQEIEEKYEKKKQEIKDKYLWQNQKENVDKIKQKEQEDAKKEQDEAEWLLDMI
jgi:hypothetical protein